MEVLRIIAGSAKGRKIKSIKGKSTRPTSARVKESIFNIISDRIDSSIVLDLFSGTGSFGLECLSRGAQKVTFIEVNLTCIKIIYENVRLMNFLDKSQIIKGRVYDKLYSLKDNKYDLIFIDPPYSKNLEMPVIERISQNDMLSDKGIIILEHSARDVFPVQINQYIQWKNRRYGDTCVTFFIKGGIE